MDTLLFNDDGSKSLVNLTHLYGSLYDPVEKMYGGMFLCESLRLQER